MGSRFGTNLAVTIAAFVATAGGVAAAQVPSSGGPTGELSTQIPVVSEPVISQHFLEVSPAEVRLAELADEDVSDPEWTDFHIDFADPPNPLELTIAENELEVVGEPTVGQAGQGGDPNFTDPAYSFGANDFSINYLTAGIPAAERAVIDATMEAWASSVDMNSGRIDVQIEYVAMSGSALASTSHAFVILSDGSTMPTALLNASLGGDQFPGSPDIRIIVNSNINWSSQLSGPISSSQYSLYATMLHEIGHGLGFSSSFNPSSAAGDPHTSFDARLFYDLASGGGAGPSAPRQTISSPSVTTGQAWFLNLDGTWERIYDPTSYQGGSSMSHFDEATYSGFTGAAGSVMTPTQYNGETSYEIDAVVLGGMEAAGWHIKAAPAAPNVSSANIGPGSTTVAVSPNTGTANPPAAQWRVVIKQGPSTIATTTVAATDRSITVPGYLPAGTYTISIFGVGTGGTSSPVVLTVTSTNAAAPTYTNCRQAPVNPIFNTTNEVNASVYRLYCAYFLRYPDLAGFGFWFDTHVNEGWSLARISDFFATGAEFDATYGSLNNDQFVTLIYNNVLSRSPEPVGYAFWVNQLNSGGFTRGEVMLFFSQSDEFKGLTGT